MLSVSELLHSIVERTHWTEESDRNAAHEAVDEHFSEKSEPAETEEKSEGDDTHE